jgi:glutaredoxin-related protein
VLLMGTEDVVRRGRVLLHGVLSSAKGDRLPPLRWTRRALSFCNDLAGRPLCSEDELRRREAERAAYAAEAAAGPAAKHGPAAPARREPAPVVLYITDQDMRTKKKLEEILKGRDIAYLINDVTDDEASRSWALTQAKKLEFPLLFVAGEAVGGLDEVMQLDVTGGLVKKVFG